MTATTCLGPFLAISVFAEEDPAVAEKYFNGKQSSSAVRSLAKQLQTELEMLRVRFTFPTTNKAVLLFLVLCLSAQIVIKVCDKVALYCTLFYFIAHFSPRVILGWL
jgi:hypothetical protein